MFVLISGSEVAVECWYQPCVNILRDSQKIIPPLKLKNFEHFRESCDALQIETPPPCYGSPEEISMEVVLHFIIFKNVWYTLINFSSHSEVAKVEA